MKIDNYELLRCCMNDIDVYIKEMIDYLDNQKFYDNCKWYYQDEVIAYFKSIPETIEEMFYIINELEKNSY